MKQPDIVDATREHCLQVAAHIRPADAAEIVAIGYATPLDGILRSFEGAVFARVWIVDGRAACIFGMSTRNLMGGTGQPWLITTDLVEANRRTFIRHCRRWVGEMLRVFPHIENYVDARHQVCLRWLAWLGFTIHDAQLLNGHALHRFEMGK